MLRYFILFLLVPALVILTGCEAEANSSGGVSASATESNTTEPEPMNDTMPVEPDGGIGDGAQPLPLLIAVDVAPDLLGLERSEAERRLEESGATWRIIAIDGQRQQLSTDFILGRINLSVQSGVVNGVNIEGT